MYLPRAQKIIDSIKIKGLEKSPDIISTETDATETFQSSALGVKLVYPSNWQKTESTDGVRFVSPKEDSNDKYQQKIDLFTYPSMSLIEATESLTGYYNRSLTNFTVIGSPQASTFANSSSVLFLYSFDDSNIGPVRSMDFLVSPESNDKIYLFTFRDQDLKFDPRFT